MQPTHKHNAVIVRTPADLKKKKKKEPHLSLTNFNGDWTEWNPVRSGIIRKTDIKIGRTQTGGTFVNHENNFRQYFYDGKAVTNFSKQGHLLRNNTYQLNVFRTNIYSCFFFSHERMKPIVDLTKCKWFSPSNYRFMTLELCYLVSSWPLLSMKYETRLWKALLWQPGEQTSLFFSISCNSACNVLRIMHCSDIW